VQFHMEHGKAATVCTIPCEHEQAHRFGIIVNGQDGTINTFLEKPLSLEDIVPPHIYPYASMGIYVFSTAPLLKYLKKNQGKTSHDFGKDILPDIVKSHEAVAYPFLRPDGQPYFWRDIGDLSAYQKASEEFFNGQYKLLRFDNTQGAKQLPTHLLCINTS
jgi:glucose-1-phosphate adenylyltransferase